MPDTKIYRGVANAAGTGLDSPHSDGQGTGGHPGPIFLLRSLPACRSAIPRRLFSSSLPPSFVSGRFAAFLCSQTKTARGRFLFGWRSEERRVGKECRG